MSVAEQMSLYGQGDQPGADLSRITFVVLDLETTGGVPAEAGITEIGAVKVRGGEVLGEFATLVDPGTPVPAFIASLTGITSAMLVGAPSVPSACVSLFEFIGDAVIVAHNAPYDLGFLRGASARYDLGWRSSRVVDTARLARRVLARDEVRNVKLATLASFFGSPTTPIHRALDDARATVAVLHGLLERAATHGVSTLEDLLAFTGRTHEVQRRKRALADNLPRCPGVYVFRDAQGAPLYIGTSQCIRDRVRSYFTASEPRARMREMLHLAAEVTAVPCASALEAQVREIRLIDEHRPPYNRRSRTPERQQWLALSSGKQPRLTITGRLAARHRIAIGPYPSRASALSAAEALLAVLPDRGRIGGSPLDPIDREAADDLARVMSGDARPLIEAVTVRIRPHQEAGRFERAGVWRDRLEAALLGLERSAILASLVRAGQIGAARLEGRRWILHVIREGRLVAAGVAEPGRDPRDVLSSLYAMAEDVPPADRSVVPRPHGLLEESRLLWAWLSDPHTRLVHIEHPLSLPVFLGGQLLATVRSIRSEERSAIPRARAIG